MNAPTAVVGVGSLALLVVLGLVAVRGEAPGPDPGPGASLSRGEVPFDAPVPVAADETYVRTRVLPTGDLRVEHWIRSRALVFHLVLARPATTGVDRSRVVARSVEVEADGRTVLGPDVVGAREEFDFLGAHRVHLAYTLSGVLTRSSVIDRRALVQAVALRVGLTGPPPRLRYAVAGDVVALACADPSPRALPRPCGREARGGWSVDLGRSAGAQRVLAQVDLP